MPRATPKRRAQATEANLAKRIAKTYDALGLPDGGSPELRQMAEKTLLAVALVLTMKMQRATALIQ